MVKKNVNFTIDSEVYKELKGLAVKEDITIGGAIEKLIRFYKRPNDTVAAEAIIEKLSTEEGRESPEEALFQILYEIEGYLLAQDPPLLKDAKGERARIYDILRFMMEKQYKDDTNPNRGCGADGMPLDPNHPCYAHDNKK